MSAILCRSESSTDDAEIQQPKLQCCVPPFQWYQNRTRYHACCNVISISWQPWHSGAIWWKILYISVHFAPKYRLSITVHDIKFMHRFGKTINLRQVNQTLYQSNVTIGMFDIFMNLYSKITRWIYTLLCQNLGKIFTGPTRYFWALRSFQMFTGTLFQTKQHLISTVLSQWISTFHGSFGIHWFRQYLVNFAGLVGIVNAIVHRTDPIFTGLRHGKLS